jgi:hypothetical protein
VQLIDVCVDVNPNKQSSFVPLTGHRISAPKALRSGDGGRPTFVVVMNENYRDEIEAMCRELGVRASLVSLRGGQEL